jgi:predicted dehydrogenase
MCARSSARLALPCIGRVTGVALIGCGHWGPKLARSLRAVGGELRVLCDLEPARLDALQRSTRCTRTTTDFRRAIDDPDVGAVAVCTPVATHFEIAKAALEADRHVLVEKPLADSVRRAEELVELADRRGLVLHVDHTLVHSAGIQTIRRIIGSGEIGELLYIDCVRINLGHFQSDVDVLWDLAPHDLSVVCALVERRPRWVSAVGATHLGRFVSQAYLTVQFEDSPIAHLHVSWLAPVKIRTTLIGGSKRMLAYDDLAPNAKILLYESGSAMQLARGEPGPVPLALPITGENAPWLEAEGPLASVCASFLRSIETGEPALTDARPALEVVRIVEGAQTSLAREGERIALNRP